MTPPYLRLTFRIFQNVTTLHTDHKMHDKYAGSPKIIIVTELSSINTEAEKNPFINNKKHTMAKVYFSVSGHWFGAFADSLSHSLDSLGLKFQL